MPELPEVETTRRGIEPHIVGKTVAKVIVRQPKLRWPIPACLSDELTGQTIERLERRAKYLLFKTANGVMIGHLGMSGSMRLVATGEEAQKHDHVDVAFVDGLTLRFTDPRRFGALLWCDNDALAQHELLAHLGPEPLAEEFNGELLHRLSRKRKTTVKQFVMDGHIVVGVGNIYANEALFAAGIHPKRAAGNISLPRYQRLALEIKQVLSQAIQQGGTTLRDFVGGDGKPGYFKQRLQVYGRANLPCVQCQTPLTEIRLGQRSTVYCKNCQK